MATKPGDKPNHQDLGFSWRKLANVEEDISRISGEALSAAQRLGELETELKQAEISDREAYADHLLAGKDAPKTSKAEAVEHERAELQRRKEALDAALEKLHAKSSAIVRENRVGWQREVSKRLPSAKKRVREASKAIVDAVDEMNKLVSLYNYLESPDQYRAKEAASTVTLGVGKIGVEPFLTALNQQVNSIERHEPAPRPDPSELMQAHDVDVRI
jgi:chromosome segregation ATPase